MGVALDVAVLLAVLEAVDVGVTDAVGVPDRVAVTVVELVAVTVVVPLPVRVPDGVAPGDSVPVVVGSAAVPAGQYTSAEQGSGAPARAGQ